MANETLTLAIRHFGFDLKIIEQPKQERIEYLRTNIVPKVVDYLKDTLPKKNIVHLTGPNSLKESLIKNSCGIGEKLNLKDISYVIPEAIEQINKHYEYVIFLNRKSFAVLELHGNSSYFFIGPHMIAESIKCGENIKKKYKNGKI